MGATDLSPWLRERLVCPRDTRPLVDEGESLVCAEGHRYPCYDGIPVLIIDDITQTHWIATYSLAEPEVGGSVEVSDGIDPYVREAVGATCGNFYGGDFPSRMTEYPIPAMPIAPIGDPDVLLDVGCNWGRWTTAAARAGFRAVGIDPALVAVRAARRVATQLHLDTEFVVGDARHLPFRDETFNTTYSYSVLQHFSEEDVMASAREMKRVLADDGRAFVQMATRFGVRNIMQQARRGFRAPKDFEVRYWRQTTLGREFTRAIGPSTLSADAFLSLNAQLTDLPQLTPRDRWLVRFSQAMKEATARVPPLIGLADSVYVHARVSR